MDYPTHGYIHSFLNSLERHFQFVPINLWYLCALYTRIEVYARYENLTDFGVKCRRKKYFRSTGGFCVCFIKYSRRRIFFRLIYQQNANYKGHQNTFPITCIFFSCNNVVHFRMHKIAYVISK